LAEALTLSLGTVSVSVDYDKTQTRDYLPRLQSSKSGFSCGRVPSAVTQARWHMRWRHW